jgi:hypothetical protein
MHLVMGEAERSFERRSSDSAAARPPIPPPTTATETFSARPTWPIIRSILSSGVNHRVGDGGFTDWIAQLLNDAKEPCVISCVATERLASVAL